MSDIYNVDEKANEHPKIPNVEHDISRAKLFLQKPSPETGDSLYDHLSALITKILADRPKNAVDIFEDYSRKLKDERFRSKTDYLRDLYVPPFQYEEAKKFKKLYQALKTDGGNEDVNVTSEEKSDDTKQKSPDILELFFNLEQIDIGLPGSEIVALDLSIRKLIAEKPIENVRFWGKIIGKPKNYFIVEAELFSEELLARRSAEEEATEQREETEDSTKLKKDSDKVAEEMPTEAKIPNANESTTKLQLIFPPLPNNLWKDPVIVPAESIGIGVNRNVYYVCNSPGIDDWIELPSVTPQQIVAARHIVRVFTGDPETPIYTFPTFPGTEKNYLRAQIARISSATLVSPIGYFTFGESMDEEDEEEAPSEFATERDEAGFGMISMNRHYEPLPLKELIDPSMSNWCHHSPFILNQGRTVWWNPNKGMDENDVDEEDEDEIEDEEKEVEESEINSADFRKEVGPPMLTPLSEDTSLESIGAWTTRASSTIKSDHTAIAIVRSNIWPGSFAYAKGKTFANVYIGMGQKFTPYNYSPPGMSMIQEQYKIGPEIMEIQEPSLKAEEAYRTAHLPPSKPEPLELGGEGESPRTEDDDDDDDDDEDDED